VYKRQLQHSYNLYRKKNIGHFIRRPSKKFEDVFEYDELSQQEKEEWKELWKTNIQSFLNMFEEIINKYEKQYDNLKDGSRMKTGINDVLNVLYFDFENWKDVMYPKIK
jgi:hypothetical protein